VLGLDFDPDLAINGAVVPPAMDATDPEVSGLLTMSEPSENF